MDVVVEARTDEPSTEGMLEDAREAEATPVESNVELLDWAVTTTNTTLML